MTAGKPDFLDLGRLLLAVSGIGTIVAYSGLPPFACGTCSMFSAKRGTNVLGFPNADFLDFGSLLLALGEIGTIVAHGGLPLVA